MVIDIADRVEKKAFKPKGMLVRTSHSTSTMFEANKIADSLIKEAKMPVDLAQRTQKRLRSFYSNQNQSTLQPLVTRIVNAILIEKGSKTTPTTHEIGHAVHEVSALWKERPAFKGSASILTKQEQAYLANTPCLAFSRETFPTHMFRRHQY